MFCTLFGFSKFHKSLLYDLLWLSNIGSGPRPSTAPCAQTLACVVFNVSVRRKTLLNVRQRSRCLQSVQRFQENGATVFYISHALIASVFMYTSISSSPCYFVHGDGDDTYQKGLYFGHGKVTSPHTDNMCDAKNQFKYWSVFSPKIE